MTNEQVAQTAAQLKQLDFVDEIQFPDDTSYVHILLAPRLTAVLPPAYNVLQIPRSDFTVERVISDYAIVVEKLQELADTAHEMLGSALKQTGIDGERREYDT
ncbi:hypothetical protein [Spirosoma sp. KNUC1025]|uniref:hypothetical protein n=1 Tax=Spirosoma sp. KNUC1025 TaxID=2894082 RepID=UPI00386BB8CD|nr:hypothetical protein LN737_19365 [Spirosoma sp. KNUC1025]